MNEHQNFFLRQQEPNSSCLLALRSIILNQHVQISETLKYGMPCFVYAKKAICYLWIDKKTTEPYILFVEGHLLNNSELEIGTRSRMKILRINPDVDIPFALIENIIAQLLAYYNSELAKHKKNNQINL